jgi:hypothetical protein
MSSLQVGDLQLPAPSSPPGNFTLGASLALLPGVGLKKILAQRRNSRRTRRLGLAPNAKDSADKTLPTLMNSSSYSFQRAARTLVVVGICPRINHMN